MRVSRWVSRCLSSAVASLIRIERRRRPPRPGSTLWLGPDQPRQSRRFSFFLIFCPSEAEAPGGIGEFREPGLCYLFSATFCRRFAENCGDCCFPQQLDDCTASYTGVILQHRASHENHAHNCGSESSSTAVVVRGAATHHRCLIPSPTKQQTQKQQMSHTLSDTLLLDLFHTSCSLQKAAKNSPQPGQARQEERVWPCCAACDLRAPSSPAAI